MENPNEWQVSMDKNYWTIPESASMYNKPATRPDAPQNIIAQIKPQEILPMRNAKTIGTDGVQIGKNGYALIDFFSSGNRYSHFSGKGKRHCNRTSR